MEKKQIDYLKLLSQLPNLTFDGEVTDENILIPMLYRYGKQWNVSWVTEDGESNIDIFSGDTIEKAITKAYIYCIKKGYVNGDIAAKDSDLEEKKFEIIKSAIQGFCSNSEYSMTHEVTFNQFVRWAIEVGEIFVLESKNENEK